MASEFVGVPPPHPPAPSGKRSRGAPTHPRVGATRTTKAVHHVETCDRSSRCGTRDGRGVERPSNHRTHERVSTRRSRRSVVLQWGELGLRPDPRPLRRRGFTRPRRPRSHGDCVATHRQGAPTESSESPVPRTTPTSGTERASPVGPGRTPRLTRRSRPTFRHGVRSPSLIQRSSKCGVIPARPLRRIDELLPGEHTPANPPQPVFEPRRPSRRE